MSEQLSRYFESLYGCFVVVDESRINLDDLVNAWPGGIVRCDGSVENAVSLHVAPNDPALGCIGGFISDSE